MTDNLTRPIVGIENRTAQEVFDIMVDRIRRSGQPPQEQTVSDEMIDAGLLKLKNNYRPLSAGGVSIDERTLVATILNAALTAPPETRAQPFAWYWHDQHGCLYITGDDRKPEVPAGAKPLYEHPPQEQLEAKP